MTQSQIETLLLQISEHGFSFSVWSYMLIGVVALLGSYLGAYLKKRGEHYATRQDMDTILLQLKDTTRVAEGIRGEISKGVWVEQNRWNLKRDFYVVLLDNLNQSVDAIDEIIEIESGENPGNGKGREETLWNQIQEATNKIHKAIGPARLFLDSEAVEAIGKYYQAQYTANQTNDWWIHLDGTQVAAHKAYEELLTAAEKDLAINISSAPEQVRGDVSVGK